MAAMLSKIVTVASIVLICTAAPPQPVYSTKQAMSSQSYVRHDVPLAYSYTAVHVHPTEKTEHKNEVGPIQYAPLYSMNKYHKNDLNARIYFDPGTENQNKNQEKSKSHLEPKEKTSIRNSLSYIPGHNIELLPSVNRSPGLYTEYRSIPETTSEATSKSTEKINYHRAFTIYKRPETELNVGPHPQEVITYSRPPFQESPKLFPRIVQPAFNIYRNDNPNAVVNPVLEQQLLKTQQRLEDIHDLTKQIESQRVVGYPKMNTLLLNLARVYNSRIPTKNHINYLASVNRVPSNNQPLVMPPDQVNQIIPVSSNRVHNREIKLHVQH